MLTAKGGLSKLVKASNMWPLQYTKHEQPIHDHRQFFDSIAKDLHFTSPVDWYQLTTQGSTSLF